MLRITFWGLFLVLGLATSAHGENYPQHEILSGSQRALTGVRDQSINSAGDLPKVAIYQDRGVWSVGYEHLTMFFIEHGFDYEAIDARDIRGGYLAANNPDILVMPGGQSWTYLDSLGEAGAIAVRDFVAGGGGYVGICAGAFYAISDRDGGAATGPYGIGLLTGTAYDGTAHRTPPFRSGMMSFDMDLSSFPTIMRIVLLGGPSMLYSDDEADAKQVRVVSRFQQVVQPAMILFEYGDGRVFLSGPHLEVEEDRWDRGYRDPESDWPLLETMMRALLTP